MEKCFNLRNIKMLQLKKTKKSLRLCGFLGASIFVPRLVLWLVAMVNFTGPL
jgi:hypothetical protein